MVPSVPGFGFSEKRPLPSPQIADLWAELMQSLGYTTFMATGGDVGGPVTLALAQRHPDRVTGIHVTDIGYPTGQEPDLSPSEQKFAEYIQGWYMTQGGYALMQSTKPDSVGMGLNDSPAGLAAWMLNLINTGAEDHDVEQAFGEQERLLTNFSLYWLTGTGLSSARWYWTEAQIMQAQKEIPEWANVPTAFLLLPREAPTPPDWVRRKADLVRFTNLPRGGHFIALEVPELFAADLKAFRHLLVDREE